MLHLPFVQCADKPQEGLPLCLRAATVSHLQGQKSTRFDFEIQDTIQHTVSKPTSAQDSHTLSAHHKLVSTKHCGHCYYSCYQGMLAIAQGAYYAHNLYSNACCQTTGQVIF